MAQVDLALPAGSGSLVGRFCASPWLQPGLVSVIHPSDQEGTCTKSESSLCLILIFKKYYK